MTASAEHNFKHISHGLMGYAEKNKIRFYEHNPWGLKNDNSKKAYTNDNVIDIWHQSKDA